MDCRVAAEVCRRAAVTWETPEAPYPHGRWSAARIGTAMHIMQDPWNAGLLAERMFCTTA